MEGAVRRIRQPAVLHFVNFGFKSVDAPTLASI